MDRRTVLCLGAAALTAMAARAENVKPAGSLSADPTEIIPLWPSTPPGGEGVNLTAEIGELSTNTDSYHDRYVHKIGKPLLTVMRPTSPDGSAVLIVPGGGYSRIVIDREGLESGRRLNVAGVTVFILRYRLPSEGWTQASDVPLQDAQRAIRLIRAHATHYGVDPKRVGVLGFSAGGHVSASLATRFGEKVYEPVDTADRLSARPDFVGLMYSVITMYDSTHFGSRKRLLGPDPSLEAIAKYSCEKHVTADTPPTFLCYSQDDTIVPPIGNSLAIYQALAAAKVPVELHVFQEGVHGFGIRLAKGMPCSVWPDLFLHWGGRSGWFRGTGAVV